MRQRQSTPPDIARIGVERPAWAIDFAQAHFEVNSVSRALNVRKSCLGFRNNTEIVPDIRNHIRNS
jgi:hypothetical protein